MSCTEPDCGRRAQARGLCGRHYSRWWKAQNPSYMTRYRAEHRERMAEYRRAYEARHPGRKR